MKNITLRLAIEKDGEELEEFLVFNNGESNQELAQDYIQSSFSTDYRRPTFIVAHNADNKIIGAAAYSEELFTVGVWGISWVSVHKDYRSQGIGQSLVEKCIEHISQDAKKTVTVILATYPEKTELYERSGFVHSGKDHEGGSLMTKTVEYGDN